MTASTVLKHQGPSKFITGDYSNITGNCTSLKGDVSNLTGNVSHIHGDGSGLSGDATNSYIRYIYSNDIVFGDVTHNGIEACILDIPTAEVL